MKEYNIKKKKHYASGFHFKPVYDKRELEVKVMFDETCLYKLEENYDQINKLIGISQGMHHRNSARYGWRCIDGKKIELLSYCYINKKRQWKLIRTVSVNRWIKIKLSITDDAYVFKTGSKEVIVKRNSSAMKLGVMLNPYFGGKIAAPHNMKITIK